MLALALLITPHKNRRANAVLAVLTILIILPLWNLHVSEGTWQGWAIPPSLMWASLYLWGPALHFYVATVSGQSRLDGRQIFLYIAPAALIAFLTFTIGKFDLVQPPQMVIFKFLRLMTFYVIMASCFYACFRLLRNYDRRIKDTHSHIKTINLTWLKRLTAVFALAILADMVLSIPALLRGSWSPYLVFYLMAEVIVVFAIGYFAMLKSAVEFGAQLDDTLPAARSEPLDEKLVDELTAKLHAAMGEAQVYKKNDLKLSDLAEMVDVRKDVLSRFLNETCQKNFYEYVNEYRVKSATELLSADKKANIEKVAFDAGFNNRVSFHHAFKKLTGMTPSQYRDSRPTSLLTGCVDQLGAD